jgi:hypothetical protein
MMTSFLPKYIYHYTSINTLKSILESGTWRLYDIGKQNDRFELFYSGNKLFKYYYDKLFSTQMKNTNDFNNEVIQFCVVALNKYFTNNEVINEKNILNQSIKNAENGTLAKQFNQNLENRELQFFISSFSFDSDNEHLWAEYGDKGKGVCIELNTEFLKIHSNSEIGIKPVWYYNDKELIFQVENLIASYESKYYTNSNEKFLSIVKAMIDLLLKAKQKIYKVENEIRLIDHFETKTSRISKHFDHNSDRYYTDLPIGRAKLLSHINCVYVKKGNPTNIKELVYNYNINLLEIDANTLKQ